MNVKEAVDGEILFSGTIYVAPGALQMGVTFHGNKKVITVNNDTLVNGHAPSVGYLFNSLKAYSDVTAVILTGMGRDGSAEIGELRANGAHTIAQDEESSVVFGMPGEAIKRGGICEILSLHCISEKLIQKVKE